MKLITLIHCLLLAETKKYLRHENNNNNNNNNYYYYYLQQLGCHPVAVVILHVYKI